MAMKRLSKEVRKMQKTDMEGVSAEPVDDTLVRWTAKIEGPEGSVYEGGTFDLDVQFPADYPMKPPAITFTTKVYHPNVTSEGGICLDILKDAWSPQYFLDSVLTSVRMLLEEPNPSDSLEPAIAKQFTDDKAAFEKTAKEWVEKYAT